jgi:NADH:ubiquinone oxidoreductase subunit 6 (subunit J)
MLLEIAFFVSAAVAVCAGLFIFRAKEMSHAMVGFLGVAIAGAALLAVLGLPLLALLQLFIMVGGVSTYLFVGVSSDNLSRFKHTSFPFLVVLAIALLVVPVYKVIIIGFVGQPSAVGAGGLAASIGPNLTLFYMLAVALFGIGIASIMMMKGFKMGGKR